MSASRSSKPSRRVVRPLAAGAALLTLLLALSACGSSSHSSTNAAATGAQQPRGGRGFAQNAAVQACLKKQGVTLPGRRAGGGRRPPGAGRYGYGGPGTGTNGTPPTGTSPTPPTGTTTTPPTTPNGAPAPGANGRRFGGPGRDPAQFAKLRAALKKCGVQALGRRPGGGPPPGGTPTTPGTAS